MAYRRAEFQTDWQFVLQSWMISLLFSLLNEFDKPSHSDVNTTCDSLSNSLSNSHIVWTADKWTNVPQQEPGTKVPGNERSLHGTNGLRRERSVVFIHSRERMVQGTNSLETEYSRYRSNSNSYSHTYHCYYLVNISTKPVTTAVPFKFYPARAGSVRDYKYIYSKCGMVLSFINTFL